MMSSLPRAQSKTVPRSSRRTALKKPLDTADSVRDERKVGISDKWALGIQSVREMGWEGRSEGAKLRGRKDILTISSRKFRSGASRLDRRSGRSWGYLEPLLHAEWSGRGCGSRAISDHGVWPGPTFSRSRAGAYRDGSGHSLDLGQWATSRTWAWSHRGERPRAPCDLAQRSQKRSGGRRRTGSLCATRFHASYDRYIQDRRSAGDTDSDPRARDVLVRLRTAAVNAVRGANRLLPPDPKLHRAQCSLKVRIETRRRTTCIATVTSSKGPLWKKQEQ